MIPNKDCVFIIDGEELQGAEAFLDHILKRDITIDPDQQRSDVISAMEHGFDHPTEALNSVNKRLGTDYKKFSEIPREDLAKAAKERRIEEVNNAVDDVADRLIQKMKKLNLSADLPEGTQQQGAGMEDVIRFGADMVKKAYKAGEDVKAAIEAAIEHIKSNWDEAYGKFDEEAFRDGFEGMYKATGVFAQDTPREESTGGLKPIDFPELVQIARAIAGGKYPLTKEMRGALGSFSTRLKNIALSRDMFKAEHYDDLLKVIAHEIGHFIDFIPDETMKRGNILGRIASLKDFMNKFLPFKPGAEGELTAADRARIAKEVKDSATKTTREIDEEIERTIGLTAQDVKDVWNSVDAGRNNPELLDFIQKLSDADKLSIVKEAMKGIVSDKLKSFVRTIKEKTGRKITVTDELDEAAIKAEIKKRIEDEIKKRKLWNNDEIFDEAYKLSKAWRPFNETLASPHELKYRKSGEEVYADMISVLFNSPGTLEAKAPKFFEAFMNYLDAKPEFKQVYEDTMRLLNDPREIQAARTANVLEGFEAARQRQKQMREHQAALRSGKSAWQTIMQQYISLAAPLYKGIPNEKLPGSDLTWKQHVRNQVEKMFMWKSKTALLMDDYKKMTDNLIEHGIDLDHIGAVVKYVRNLQRVDVANPLGFQLESHNLDAIQQIFDVYNPEQQAIIDKTLKQFYETNFDVMQDAYDKGLLTQDMWQIAQKNKYGYATFRVVDYIDEKLQTAKIINVKGTLKEIANPFVETMIKMSFIQRAAERNNAISTAKEALMKFVPGSVKETKINAFTKLPEDEVETNKELIYHKVNGKTRVFIADKDVAKIFNYTEPVELDTMVKVANTLAMPLKAAWTRYNPGFVYYSNIIKDGQRSMSNLTAILSMTDKLKWYNYLTMLPEYLSNIPKGLGTAHSILSQNPNEIAKRMLASGAINPESAIFSKYNPEMDAMGNIMSHFEATQNHLGIEKAKKSAWRAAIDILSLPLEYAFSKPGQHIEMMNKSIGYKMLEKRLGTDAAGFYTRNYVGTPNYSEKTSKNYSWIPFAKVILQGLRNDIELASNRKSAGAYWLTKGLYSMMPAVMMGAAMKGWFDRKDVPKGQRLSDNLHNLSKYQQYNYLNITMGQTTDGKTRLIQIPMDDISRVVYQETLNMFQDEDGVAHVRDAANSIKAQLPSLTGGLNLYSYWEQYMLEGVNPYDDFYHKNIISDRNFKLGGMAALGDMGKYTLKTLTGVNLPQKDLGETTTDKERMLSLPGINRVYKETNAGVYDMLKQVKQETDQAAATRLDNMDKAIEGSLDDETRKSLKDDGYDPVNINQLADKVYEKYTGKITTDTEQDKADYKLIKQKVKLMSQKSVLASIPIANAVLSASTYAQKQAILQEYQKHASPDEYQELLNILDENGVKYEQSSPSTGGFKEFKFK